MKKKLSVFRSLWVLLIILSLTGVNLAQAHSPAATPASQATTPLPGGLTDHDWRQIQAVMEYYYEQQAYLKASNTQAYDNFGYSIAVSGNTAVVGANLEDGSADDAGAAYVFVRNDGVWSFQAYLKASNNISQYDYFGESVAISGDTIVIGAPYEDGAGDSISASGAAYVFIRNGNTWSPQAYLKALNAEADDHFGYSVAISGDTLVVGALDEDSNATNVGGNASNNSSASAGAAYVFTRSGATWSQQAYLKASNTGAGDQFGSAVAISENVIVVGAPDEDGSAIGVGGVSDNNATNAGAAYIFFYDGGVWNAPVYVKASNTGNGDQFGISAAASGDTVVIGAPYEDSNAVHVNGDGDDNSAANAGAAYVFFRSGVWNQQAYLKASNTGEGDNFGIAVAVSGDSVVAGAHFEDSNAAGIDGDGDDNSASNAGAAYTFVRATGVWTPDAYVKASNTEGGDGFGYAVAAAGNLLAIGAYHEDSSAINVDGDQTNNGASNSGAAYAFFFGSGPDLGLVKSVTPASADPGDPITYTLTFSNAGGLPAAQVLLTDEIPAGIVVSDWQVSPGVVVTPLLGSEYVWQVQNLDGNAGGVITITGAAATPLAAQTITNVASIAGVGTAAVFTTPITVRQAPPSADAGADQNLKPGALGTLHGSGSDGNGDPLTYAWTQTGGPPVTLSDPGALEPTFTAPLATTALTFTLIVTDTVGGQSDLDDVVVTVANHPPDAQAGADQTVGPGATVTLNGAGSADPDGDSLAYDWQQTAGPSVVINNGNTAVAAFAAPMLASATLVFSLTVDDGYGETDSDAVVITVTNQPPKANAGSNQAVHPGVTVNLDGSASTDPEGDVLIYAWEQTGGAAVTLTNGDQVTANFTAPGTIGVLTFTLTVTDSFGLASDPDEVTVTVGNSAPVADAGPDQSVSADAAVTLDGSASSDPEGDALTYAWTQTGGPDVSLSANDQITITFTAPITKSSVLTFALTVDDGYGLNDSDEVVITVTNQAPVAGAGPDQTVAPGAMVTLDGGVSADPDGDVLTYTWTQAGGPSVPLSSNDQVTASFTAPFTVPSVLTFTLTVGDGEFTDSDDVVITVQETTIQHLCYLPLILR